MIYKNRKVVYLGYLKGLVESKLFTGYPFINIETESPTKYDMLLPVLFDDKEFLKTTYPQYGLSKGIQAAEERYKIKFPLSFEQYSKLPVETQFNISWSLYGQDTLHYNFLKYEYKELIKHKINFLVPIPVMNNDLLKVDYTKLKLPKDLLEYIRAGKAKLFIYQDAEGFFNQHGYAHWFHEFMNFFKLPKGSLIVESANVRFKKLVNLYRDFYNHKIKFKTLESTEFEDRPWFLTRTKYHPINRAEHYKKFFYYLDHKLNLQHDTKLLCLARRYSAERAVVFTTIQNTPILRDNTLASLHNPYENSKEHCLSLIESTGVSNVKEIKDWLLSNFDFVNGWHVDRDDFDNNWAEVINDSLQNRTFVNVVMETHQLPTTELFLSEKSYRPMYTANPFIIFGNPGTLAKLKKDGYKTFDKFWDESYDEDVDLSIRLSRLIKTMETIANTPWDTINSWMEEIELILVHNFNTLMSMKRIYNKQSILYREIKNEYKGNSNLI